MCEIDNAISFADEQEVRTEEDQTRRQRLVDLFEEYKRNPSTDIATFIQNVASTYEKLLVTEVDVQNNVTREFLDFLTKTLMMLAVIKRDWNTLQSLVSRANVSGVVD